MRVVDRVGGRKHIRAVAILADVAGLNMRQTLAHSVCSVVARRAIVHDVKVIENCR